MKILIVEDEPDLVDDMVRYLHRQNYLCEIATTAQQGSEKIAMHQYDCILLDLGLPDGDGLDLIRQVKSEGRAEGIIIISASDGIEKRVEGLQLGADDYLTKPFHLAELSARVSALLRRKHFEGSNLFVHNELAINPVAKSILVNGKLLEVTRKEFDLLLFLVMNRGRVISKNAIAEHLTGDDAEVFANFDFVYAHIKNLKRKLTDAGCKDYIKTMYGVGYKFEA